MSFNPSTLGAGNAGLQPGLIGYMDGGNERAVYRKHLAKAFGNLHNTGPVSYTHLRAHET